MAIVIREGILVTPHRLSDSLWDKDVSVNWTKGGVQKEGLQRKPVASRTMEFQQGVSWPDREEFVRPLLAALIERLLAGQPMHPWR